MKNKKSFNQEAFENYSWEVSTKKFFKHARISAFVLGGLAFIVSVILLAGSRFWDYGVAGTITCIFICLIPSFVVGGMWMSIFMILFEYPYRNRKKRERMIDKLSEAEKRTVLIDYIRKQIENSNREIRFCEREIAPFERAKNYHRDRIDMLNSELSNL